MTGIGIRQGHVGQTRVACRQPRAALLSRLRIQGPYVNPASVQIASIGTQIKEMAPVRQEGRRVVSGFTRPVDCRKRRQHAAPFGHTYETLRRAKDDHTFAAPGASKKYIPAAIADGLDWATGSVHFSQLARRRKGNVTAIRRPKGGAERIIRASQRPRI